MPENVSSEPLSILLTFTMSTIRQIVLLLAGASAGLWLLWGSELPLGIPGEWTWPRIPFNAESVAGWLTAALAGGLYLAFVFVGGRRLEGAGRWSAAAWVLALVLFGCGWLLNLVGSVPGIAGLSRTPLVLYYQRSSGYFWQARNEVDSTAEFLAGYEALLAKGDYLHIGTHPPGLTLFFRGTLNVLEDAPALTAAINATQPQPVRDAAELIRTQSLATGRVFTAADEACLWAAALFAALLAAATVAPLYALLRQTCDRPTAWYAAALWPLVPAVAVFFPKSDAVFPFLSVLGPCLWWMGWRRGSLSCCALAGATLWIGMLLSLAFAPVAIFIAIWTMLDDLRPQAPETPRRSVRGKLACIAAAAAGFFLPIALCVLLVDLNLLRVWSWNVRNHATFYDHNVRTWWKWLLVNPLETALAAGIPLTIAAAFGFSRARSSGRIPFAVALGLTWGLLWLSGKNMGETARLWILFLPWLVYAAAPLLQQWVAHSGAQTGRHNRRWIALLFAAQLVTCIGTATRIDGFHFAELQGTAQPAEE